MSRQAEHRFEQMVAQSADYQRSWRKQNSRHFEFYDGSQWSEADLAVLNDRGQHPTVINLCRAQVDMLAAIQIESASDIVLVGREAADDELSHEYTSLLRQVEETSKYKFHRNASFMDGLKGGIGWLHLGVKTNGVKDKKQIWVRRRPWEEFFWDPYAVEATLEDARFIARTYWIDRDSAAKQWPGKKEEIEQMHETALGPHQDDFNSQETNVQSVLATRPLITMTTNGRRIRVTEMWYREADDEIHRVVYSGPVFLEGSEDGENPSPFDDKDIYPFVPFTAFKDRHGNPMGIIAFIISLQELLNKVNSKYLHALSSYTAMFEEGAIDDMDELYHQLAKPDTMIRVNDGAMKDGRITVSKQSTEMVHLKEMITMYISLIQRVTGVNDTLLGFSTTNARSALQESSRAAQGTAMQTTIMESFNLTNQKAAEIVVKLIGQFYDDDVKARIVGSDGNVEFASFDNEIPTGVIDEVTGELVATGETVKQHISDILRYDVIFKRVSTFTSMREHQLKMIVEVIKAQILPPEVAGPLVIENLDLDNKQEILARLNQAMQPAQEQQMLA